MFTNFSWITSRLAAGGVPSSTSDIVTLLDYGITHIIDCYDQSDDAQFFGKYKDNIHYLWNPTADDGAQDQAKQDWIIKSVVFGLPVLLDSNIYSSGKQTKIYCHCQAGVNRGPSTAYALMRAAWGMTSEDSLLLIRKHRPIDIVGVRYASVADIALQAKGYIE